MWGNHNPQSITPQNTRSIPTCVGQPGGALGRAQPGTVYPHVCGATSGSLSADDRARGLSPRVWGNRRAMVSTPSSAGSIPTCVGQPSAPQDADVPTEVYPHVCGATLDKASTDCGDTGLSPRVWGNRHQRHALSLVCRSIPTCVGQPHLHNAAAHCAEVYPHVCGATTFALACPYVPSGLSPRVWGNHRCGACKQRRTRSIPTCVGQPLDGTMCFHPAKVYPHVCGATLLDWARTHRRWGLSPRVWGNHRRKKMRDERTRSIPTCVGQPGRDRRRNTRAEVYPHVCGATQPALRRTDCRQGLSPRVWGNQLPGQCQAQCPRSIPTCVGQPRPCSPVAAESEVYPHVCGATFPVLPHSRRHTGLSPRVWGNLRCRRWLCCLLRSIPTCVGQPYGQCPCRPPH